MSNRVRSTQPSKITAARSQSQIDLPSREKHGSDRADSIMGRGSESEIAVAVYDDETEDDEQDLVDSTDNNDLGLEFKIDP